ncbi:MAG: hypothetical protein ACIALR_08670, partial [Blastopirellula sp. JB062]
MSRPFMTLACAVLLTIAAAAQAEEPGEGLIDGLIAQIRQLEERLEAIESQVDRNAAAIDRNEAISKSEAEPEKVQPNLPANAFLLEWAPAEPIDYSGKWLMTLPQGAEHHVTVKATNNNRFKIAHPRLNLAGTYSAEGGSLKIVRPKQKGMEGLIWTAVNRNTLLLTGAPPQSRTGSNYVGA